MNEKLKTIEYLTYLEGFLTENRKTKFLDILQFRTNHFTVAIEDVFQMHNTSAVMRSCDVFGIQELHVVEQKFGKSIDAEIAMGAQKWVNVHQYQTNQHCIDKLKKSGYQIVATSPHNNSCLLDDFDFTKKTALFFGTERDGLSEEVLTQADSFLKIPMVGFSESLNISVAAAIILQNLTNRLRNSQLDWKLSEEEIFFKRIDWARKSIKDIDRIEERFLEG
ncbi:TrmH family RNA methyltransferase [Flavobacterium lacus]|jgi:tRNA (guanosine-2'-O-)-methyltransferase|uniref:tRNA (guanosine(18)-2'-O)-methyltransferase n=1 Tax=Flavobacterium lacus TaxID=1353778 RepID=A0A328WZA9_9FLAO|nr:RNA methyltransferase [Flavobacterium lacus]RAR48558.1 tRNA (guanosine-2'-O-)-methyltransferase [Flavobacterium lacus]